MHLLCALIMYFHVQEQMELEVFTVPSSCYESNKSPVPCTAEADRISIRCVATCTGPFFE
jgi:hypothetical protein